MKDTRFFEWVAKCCVLMGWSIKDGGKLMPDEDPSWYWCFDDGLTPEEAVKKYQQREKENT